MKKAEEKTHINKRNAIAQIKITIKIFQNVQMFINLMYLVHVR